MSIKARYHLAIQKFTTDELIEVLEQNGLNDCCGAVMKHQLDGEAFLNLSEGQLNFWRNDFSYIQRKRFWSVVQLARENPENFAGHLLKLKNTQKSKPDPPKQERKNKIPSSITASLNNIFGQQNNEEETEIYQNEIPAARSNQFLNIRQVPRQVNQSEDSEEEVEYQNEIPRSRSHSPQNQNARNLPPKPKNIQNQNVFHSKYSRQELQVEENQESKLRSHSPQNQNFTSQTRNLPPKPKNIPISANNSEKESHTEEVNYHEEYLKSKSHATQQIQRNVPRKPQNNFPPSNFYLPKPPQTTVTPILPINSLNISNSESSNHPQKTFLHNQAKIHTLLEAKNTSIFSRALPELPTDVPSFPYHQKSELPRPPLPGQNFNVNLSNSDNESDDFDDDEDVMPEYDVVSADDGNYRQQHWYKDINRKQASDVLIGKPNGTFIARPSRQETHECTLSLICENRIYNLAIVKNNGMLTIGGKDFNSVNEIIENFRTVEICLNGPNNTDIYTTLRFL